MMQRPAPQPQQMTIADHCAYKGQPKVHGGQRVALGGEGTKTRGVVYVGDARAAHQLERGLAKGAERHARERPDDSAVQVRDAMRARQRAVCTAWCNKLGDYTRAARRQ